MKQCENEGCEKEQVLIGMPYCSIFCAREARTSLNKSIELIKTDSSGTAEKDAPSAPLLEKEKETVKDTNKGTDQVVKNSTQRERKEEEMTQTEKKSGTGGTAVTGWSIVNEKSKDGEKETQLTVSTIPSTSLEAVRSDTNELTRRFNEASLLLNARCSKLHGTREKVRPRHGKRGMRNSL